MTLPVPYIAFRGQAREAMTFYQSIFGGELTISTYGEFGFEGGPADGVMHSTLASDDFNLMAADTPPGMPHAEGSQISLSLAGDDEATLRGWFDRLAEGGRVNMPLEKQVWGDLYGDVTDRYGLRWMVDIGQG